MLRNNRVQPISVAGLNSVLLPGFNPGYAVHVNASTRVEPALVQPGLTCPCERGIIQVNKIVPQEAITHYNFLQGI